MYNENAVDALVDRGYLFLEELEFRKAKNVSIILLTLTLKTLKRISGCF